MTRRWLALTEAYSRARVCSHMQSDRPIASQQSPVENRLLIRELLEQWRCMGSLNTYNVLGSSCYQFLTQRVAA